MDKTKDAKCDGKHSQRHTEKGYQKRIPSYRGKIKSAHSSGLSLLLV